MIEILQAPHDSEINFAIEAFFDGCFRGWLRMRQSSVARPIRPSRKEKEENDEPNELVMLAVKDVARRYRVIIERPELPHERRSRGATRRENVSQFIRMFHNHQAQGTWPSPQRVVESSVAGLRSELRSPQPVLLVLLKEDE